MAYRKRSTASRTLIRNEATGPGRLDVKLRAGRSEEIAYLPAITTPCAA
jgi:hypothetical protein